MMLKSADLRKLLPPSWPSILTAWIGTGFVPVSDVSQRCPVVFAATNENFAEYQMSDASITNLAVESASAAQIAWKSFPPVTRSRVLNDISRELFARNDELAVLEALDTSRPISETRTVDIISAAECFEFFASVCHVLAGENVKLDENLYAVTEYEGLGVCAGIGAWNYPIQGMAWKVAPALAAGNSFVFKPAPNTCFTALALAEIVNRHFKLALTKRSYNASPLDAVSSENANRQCGLLNVVLGGAETGQALTAHKNIAKVSFTGSLSSGLKVNKAATLSNEDSKSLKKVSMELGGKSSMIVCEDADISNAVNAALNANFFSNGQVCSNAAKVLVHTKIYKAFLEQLISKTKKIVYGFPLDEKSQMSSLVSMEHFEKVKSVLEKALVDKRLRLAAGGKVHDKLVNCIEATIFEVIPVEKGKLDTLNGVEVIREEHFGPIMCLIEFSDVQSAINCANDTEYGLAAGVMCGDVRTGMKVCNKLEAGIVYLNNYNLARVEVPWGGFKRSGIGRENGKDAMREYSKVKTVYIEGNDVQTTLGA